MGDQYNNDGENYQLYTNQDVPTYSAPYNTVYNNDYYNVPQQDFYPQPYFDPNFYDYSRDQQFVYQPNSYQSVPNGAGNYVEYGGYQDAWSNNNQMPAQSKSYRNNRYRGRQNTRGGQANSNQLEEQSFTSSSNNVLGNVTNVENGGASGSNTEATTLGEDRISFPSSLINSHEKDESEKYKRMNKKWDNSSQFKHRTNYRQSSNTNSFSGYQSQEFGAGLAKGSKLSGSDRTRASSKYDRGKKYSDKLTEDGVKENEPSSSKCVKTKSQKKMVPESSENTDQRTRMIDQLTKGRYECMVCCENMRPDTAVWNCSSCFHLFHLFCVKKWARSSTALVERGSTEGWRCPACQNITEKVPNSYKCFCGKVRDPIYNRYETPHSCGDVCNRNRKGDCQHPCTLLCHPGGCPPCSATVTKSCDCGQIKQTVRCGQNIGLKCDNKCGKKLNCLKHECLIICHSGSCQSCDQSVVQECYGKHKSCEVLCGSREDQEMAYSCVEPCNRILECKNHRCEDECHPGDCAPCSLLPDQVDHCPCGRTLLKDLSSNIERSSCLAPIPTCDKTCKKQLKCGPPDRHHQCKKVCHEGNCPPCEGSTKIKCVCKNVEKSFSCCKVATFNEINPFLCDKKCTKKRLCGRHKCGELCCKKEEHVCEMKCTRKLTCGKHKCGTICHLGNCLPCYEASFDELSCHCGFEVIFPPVACGTRPPECSKVCRRQHDCEHKVHHNCHGEDKCPPCTELTEKLCVGGHETRKNIPCHFRDIVCGYPCCKLLACGKHKCKQMCHKGECIPEGESCSQLCDVKREECGHPCGATCHQGSDCPKTPCKTEILIRCVCGNRQTKLLCQLGGDESSDVAEFQKISVESWMNQGTVEISQYKKGSKRQLECDADCAKLERNRRIALALEIENPDLQSKLGNPTYTDTIKDFARKNGEKAINIEKALYDLVNNAKQSKYSTRSHSFHAMNRDNRQFVHELAEYYGCETQSYDNEPKKNVVATAHKYKCYLPNISISTFIQREQTPTLPPPTITPGKRFGAMTTLRSSSSVKPETSSQSESSSTKPPPVIDYFDFSIN